MTKRFLTRLLAAFVFLMSISGCFWHFDHGGGGHHHGGGGGYYYGR